MRFVGDGVSLNRLSADVIALSWMTMKSMSIISQGLNRLSADVIALSQNLVVKERRPQQVSIAFRLM